MDTTLGNADIHDHGQINCMILPKGWIEGESRHNVVGNSSFRQFHPAENPDVQICFFYRGRAVNNQAADTFRRLLEQPAHELTNAEFKAIGTILRDQSEAADFAMNVARTEDLNGRRVLLVEGTYRKIPQDTFCVYVDADGSGKFVQEIFFQAPSSIYTGHVNEAKQSFKSIEWK